MSDLFKPRGSLQPRRPTDDSQKNGPIVNTPRYARFGGLSSAGKVGPKNDKTIRRPGDGKKVI